MLDWQKRVLDEKTELDGRIDRLHRFIGSPAFNDVDGHGRILLIRQARAMEHYSMVLAERIEMFPK